MVKHKTHNFLQIIYWIIGIFVGLTILYLFIIQNIDLNPEPKDFPFEVKLSPEYFDEGNYGNYDKIPFLIEISKKTGRNITSLELPRDSFKVSRKDDGLNKPASNVNWKDSRSDMIISIGSYGYYSSSDLKAEGEMSLCNNCFIGTDYPYVFTFTIYYKENGGELKSEIFNEEIPIK